MAHGVSHTENPRGNHQNQQSAHQIAHHAAPLEAILQGVHMRLWIPSDANGLAQVKHTRRPAPLKSNRINAPTCWAERPSNCAISTVFMPAADHVFARRLSSSLHGALSDASNPI